MPPRVVTTPATAWSYPCAIISFQFEFEAAPARRHASSGITRSLAHTHHHPSLHHTPTVRIRVPARAQDPASPATPTVERFVVLPTGVVKQFVEDQHGAWDDGAGTGEFPQHGPRAAVEVTIHVHHGGGPTLHILTAEKLGQGILEPAGDELYVGRYLRECASAVKATHVPVRPTVCRLRGQTHETVESMHGARRLGVRRHMRDAVATEDAKLEPEAVGHQRQVVEAPLQHEPSFKIFRDRDDASLLFSYQRPGFLFDLLAAAISGICAASHRQ
eukprot:CAMPEP_0181352380 /NCGR_PEP_ID=MMETSP1106-20121128/2277_1 /TAXON_ID=81844 /ORGANISM="Mantoniella antarctica, Strain SL-175" /LENGTH=273 /DNA_ID=CAMNT_0023464933 /DNA_START=37 /DNA_END=860 /DNA_ORIENTATION=+